MRSGPWLCVYVKEACAKPKNWPFSQEHCKLKGSITHRGMAASGDREENRTKKGDLLTQG